MPSRLNNRGKLCRSLASAMIEKHAEDPAYWFTHSVICDELKLEKFRSPSHVGGFCNPIISNIFGEIVRPEIRKQSNYKLVCVGKKNHGYKCSAETGEICRYKYTTLKSASGMISVANEEFKAILPTLREGATEQEVKMIDAIGYYINVANETIHRGTLALEIGEFRAMQSKSIKCGKCGNLNAGDNPMFCQSCGSRLHAMALPQKAN